MRFLDRFVYRNPKNINKQSGKEGREGKNVFKRKTYDPLGIRKLAVTSTEYLSKKRNEIPVDERYLHRFATLKPKVKKEAQKPLEKRDEEDYDFDDIESVNSQEFSLLLERFEPGEKNEVFDVDFGKEFAVERNRRKRIMGKRKTESGDDDQSEENEGEELDDEDMSDLEEEGGEDEYDLDKEDESMEECDSELDYDGLVEGEESDDDGLFRKQMTDSEGDSDQEFANRLSFADDAAISADKVR
ncbi:unnamed protein product [Toxocara canis]|uniref:NUC153 domain-containing protein n=1 Tax=Toxocara canis TaxID=6265 RepID=A0A183TWP5_TOXCA|nr:unnamed protein product [Toxocara canis]